MLFSRKKFNVQQEFAAFRDVPLTGVIYVMTEAEAHGYSIESDKWVNFGRGQPETGKLTPSNSRITSFPLSEDIVEYAPVNGILELRQKVADYYNSCYRKDKKSQYTADNVAISPGGRSALTRVSASLGNVNLGHFLPDYTAYEEILGSFNGFSSIPILLDPANSYAFSISDLKREIVGRGLNALLLSNPCNPTGKLIYGDELASWLAAARELNCTMILDEFYSRFIWQQDLIANNILQVSGAEFVEDVDKDPILLIDGLTKNWRYPGFRISWTVGPKKVIQALSSSGSFLDGGASHPMQIAALDLLEQEIYQQEAEAIQQTFAKKREVLLAGLKKLGINVDLDTQGTFYVWANVSNLVEDINTGMKFFAKALEHKIITVPGEFFDVNPGGRRFGRPSRFMHHVRFSFGAKLAEIEEGLARLAKIV